MDLDPTTGPGAGTGDSSAEYAILAEGLTKRFGDTIALDGVDLAVRPGTVLGLVGPHGSGKTTTVRVLTTMVKPDAGRATVGGYDVVADDQRVRRLLGVAGRWASLDESLTGRENLLLIGRLLGLSRRQARQRAEELLARFRLSDAAAKGVNTYSDGMRRRLDLAACLVGEPRLLCLDEPTTGLNSRNRLELWNLIRGLAAEDVTVLLATQQLEEADALADEVVVIDHGKVVARGTPDELKARTRVRRLVVKPVSEADLPQVVSVLAEIAGVAPDVEGHVATVPVTDAGALPAVVRRLDEAGIAISELALRRSSLDEVFLALTGHCAEKLARSAEVVEVPA